MTLNKAAVEAYVWAKEKGILSDTIDEIIDIVLDQEIVSYCSSNGTVSFDIDDIIFE